MPLLRRNMQWCAPYNFRLWLARTRPQNSACVRARVRMCVRVCDCVLVWQKTTDGQVLVGDDGGICLDKWFVVVIFLLQAIVWAGCSTVAKKDCGEYACVSCLLLCLGGAIWGLYAVITAFSGCKPPLLVQLAAVTGVASLAVALLGYVINEIARMKMGPDTSSLQKGEERKENVARDSTAETATLAGKSMKHTSDASYP